MNNLRKMLEPTEWVLSFTFAVVTALSLIGTVHGWRIYPILIAAFVYGVVSLIVRLTGR